MADSSTDTPYAGSHLFEFLTRDELALCLCIVMATKAAESYLSYPIYRYASPGQDGPTDDWTELVLRACRYLALECGLLFTGIHCRSTGSVTAERPIEPGNALYVAMFRLGNMPDFDVLLPQAIRWAQERVPTLDVAPMRELQANIEETLSTLLANARPEDLEARARVMREAVELVRGEGRLEQALGQERQQQEGMSEELVRALRDGRGGYVH